MFVRDTAKIKRLQNIINMNEYIVNFIQVMSFMYTMFLMYQ